MLERYMEYVREKTPLIHTITNAVTINDVANMLFACGARPLMSDDPVDIEEITAFTDGLVLNLGMLNPYKLEGMFLAGEKARELGHRIVLDPVGVGVSTFRLRAAKEIMERVSPDAVRGNLSEIRMLISGETGKNGVDADVSDGVTEHNKVRVAEFVMQAARKLGCIVCATGAIDFVSDGFRCFAIYNGLEMMRRVTGTGCQLSAMVAAHLASCPEEQLEAAAAAVCLLGAAGEVAREAMKLQDGNATYRNRIIDAVCCMTPDQLKAREKIEIIENMKEKRGIQDEREQ